VADDARIIRRQHAGEVFSELGVLVLVFLPLETILQKNAYWLEVSAVSFLVGVGLVIYGIELRIRAALERK
jgi:hypothetical protein